MQVELTQTPLAEIDADLHVLPRTDAEAAVPKEFAQVPGADDAKTSFKSVTLLRPESDGGPERLAIVGLGDLEGLDGERLRVAAALAAREAKRWKCSTIAWRLPVKGSDEGSRLAVADIIAGTILADYRFDRYKSASDENSDESKGIERLVISVGGEVDDAMRTEAETARVSALAANQARELQQLPSNVVTPSYLAERAQELARLHPSLSCDVLDRDDMERLGMGGLMAVSSGSAEEPKLIVLRHAGPGETLGIVGKGVTFDSGGISIKPSRGMEEMKMDMSGASAALEATGAIAELGLPISVLCVIPSTENMPSGTAVKPGDIITQLNGKTVEVNNTDAEGRLILADALAYSVEQGADRIVDLATLTGAVLVALGSTYAALISNDDTLAAEVETAGRRTGEIAWRLPLHSEFKELTKGKAGTIYAAEFLEEFVGDTPWVHLDIAGTAWDVGRDYVGSGPTGYGVRLLVDLARDLASKQG
ncbi:MAG: leucyl aminopeptidase family protein [bacterium]